MHRLSFSPRPFPTCRRLPKYLIFSDDSTPASKARSLQHSERDSRVSHVAVIAAQTAFAVALLATAPWFLMWSSAWRL